MIRIVLVVVVLMFASVASATAPVFADRTLETTTSTGTGNLTLDGAATGFRDFNTAVGVGPVFPCAITHKTLNEWELGFCALSNATTLTRTPVTSTNSNNAVNFSAGTKEVRLSPIAAVFAGFPFCDSATCSLFAAATTLQLGTGATTTDVNGGSASTGCTFTNGNLVCTNVTVSGALNAQGVYRNDQSTHMEVDETSIRGTAALQITTQNNGNVSLVPHGTGAVVLTPGTSGRVMLNGTTVTSLPSGDCDADSEVGNTYRYSKSAGAKISMCTCEKDTTYSYQPWTATGDCT